MLSSFSLWIEHHTSDSIMNHDYDLSVTSHCFHGKLVVFVGCGMELLIQFEGPDFATGLLPHGTCCQTSALATLMEGFCVVWFVIPTLAACQECFLTGSLPYVVGHCDVTFF